MTAINQETSHNRVLRFHNDIHLFRKIWHISTGLIGLYVFYKSHMDSKNFGAWLILFGGLTYFVESIRFKNKRVNEVMIALFGPLMRESERYSRSGLSFYALGTGLSLFIFDEKIAILSILFLIFSDPISSLVGIIYGKRRIFSGKSIEGSLAGFLVCLCITLVYVPYHIDLSWKYYLFALLAGLIGSFSELLSSLVDDNLSIPFVSGMGMSMLNNFFYIL